MLESIYYLIGYSYNWTIIVSKFIVYWTLFAYIVFKTKNIFTLLWKKGKKKNIYIFSCLINISSFSLGNCVCWSWWQLVTLCIWILSLGLFDILVLALTVCHQWKLGDKDNLLRCNYFSGAGSTIKHCKGWKSQGKLLEIKTIL